MFLPNSSPDLYALTVQILFRKKLKFQKITTIHVIKLELELGSKTLSLDSGYHFVVFGRISFWCK